MKALTQASSIVASLMLGGLSCETKSEAPRPVEPVAPPALVETAREEQPEPCPEVVGIWASDLIKHYAENAVRADLKYKGRLLAFNGLVRSIDSGIGDAPVVNVDGVPVYGLTPERAAALSKGDKFSAFAWGTGCTIMQTPTVELREMREDCKAWERFMAGYCASYPQFDSCKPKSNYCRDYPQGETCKPKAPAAAPASPKSAKAKAASAKRLELPCRPGQAAPCYD